MSYKKRGFKKPLPSAHTMIEEQLQQMDEGFAESVCEPIFFTREGAALFRRLWGLNEAPPHDTLYLDDFEASPYGQDDLVYGGRW